VDSRGAVSSIPVIARSTVACTMRCSLLGRRAMMNLARIRGDYSTMAKPQRQAVVAAAWDEPRLRAIEIADWCATVGRNHGEAG